MDHSQRDYKMFVFIRLPQVEQLEKALGDSLSLTRNLITHRNLKSFLLLSSYQVNFSV